MVDRNVVRRARFGPQFGAKVGQNPLLLPQISLWEGLLARSTVKCGATNRPQDFRSLKIGSTETVGCDDETVREVIRAFNERGLAALRRGSTRPHRTQATFTSETAGQLKELLHQSPRQFGKPSSLWTLELAAEVSFEQGLTPERVSDETIRMTLQRLGVKWKRAKRWITSPDPAYERKKTVGAKLSSSNLKN
jgi:transposase